MRVFKNKWFHRWARGEGIADHILFSAAKDVVSGIVEADLGGYLFKKRIAQAGRGKRGGYRVLIGYRKPNSERVIFLYAFAKNERSNISSREEAALSLVAERFIAATDRQINDLLKIGSICEVKNE